MKHTKISILLRAKTKPPYFIGSQIRGAFGYALKKVTCINPSYKCEGCFAATNCLYYHFYEQSNRAHTYRFDFELGKDFYDFSLYLFDKSCQRLPYIVSALHMMLTQNGLGKERQTYKEFELYINDKSCFIKNELKIPQDQIKTFQIDKVCQDIRLKFTTPLRIKKNNRFVRDSSIELRDIINSIYQRQMQILDRDFKKFPYPIEAEIISKDLKYKELTRQSNRQKTTMNLGGIMGEIQIKNLNEESFNVLKLGELIGVGKSTVFGLGKIEVEEIR